MESTRRRAFIDRPDADFLLIADAMSKFIGDDGKEYGAYFLYH